MSQCEVGFYPSQKQVCSPCSTNCKACSGSAANCTSCQGNSKVPNLYQSSCVATCPPKFVAVMNQCVHCTSPCSTCLNKTDQCLTCNQATQYKYFFAYQCY